MNDIDKKSIEAKLWFSPVPENEEEANTLGNLMYDSGDYPAGLSGCFAVGIQGGCGSDCYVYQNGECEYSNEIEEEQQ